MVSSQDLGPVTAYAIAVKYGFSGTEQEWANAVDAQRQAASASATSAANSASEALTAANSAKASATSISSITDSANAAVNTAANSASEALTAANSAKASATSISSITDSANAAATRANTAAKAAEDSAAGVNQTVSAANTELQSLKTQSSDIATAETARVDAEGKRATAEQGRVDAESARVTAEQARQTAESDRQTAETARESASQTAVNSADAATTRANTAAKAAEGVVAGDLLIDKPDGTAGYNRLYIDDVQTVARDTKTTIPAMRTIDTQPTFKLYGYSHQDGVPTPENPIDPVSLQSPLKVTIGTTDYSIPLTASDTNKYQDGLELRAVKNHGTSSIPDSRDYIGLGEDGRWKIYQNVNKKVVQGVEGEDSRSAHPNQQIYTPDQSKIAFNTLWLNSYTDLTQSSVNTGGYWIGYYNNTSYYWFDGNKYTLEQIQAMEKQHPMVILYGTYKTTVIDLSDDAQTVLNKMRSAIAPLANGTTLDITSTTEMDIISRSEMTKKQEQIDSNAANIAYNQLSFAAQMAQQEIEIKEQTTPFTKVTGNADMDALSTTGIYGIATSSYTNGPPGVTNHGLLIVDKNGDGTQTFLPDSTVSSVYRRVGHSDGTWGAWSEEAWVTPSQISAWTAKADKSTTINSKALSGNITLTAEDIGAAPASHSAEAVSSESGVHGLRWYDKKLQAKSGGNWDDIFAVPRAFATYGVIWHYTQFSPVLERTDDSATFTATATNGATAGHSDFDGKPIYKDLKICNVVNREVVAYEGEAGFKRDGSNGDVMVEIPKFYYKVTDDGTNRYLQLSDVSLDGFSIAPRHAPCDDYPNGLDKIYVGAYEASSEFKSISGAAPLVNLTRAQFRAGFAGRGAGYCQADWATQFELMILFIIETASLDSQSIVGQGNAGASAAINTGGSDSVTGLTGSSDITSVSVAVKWRGIENLWGNVDGWRDGINFDDGLIYVCTNPSKYADDTSTNYTTLSYSKATSDGCISNTGFDSELPWVQIPTVANGSTTTYFCDNYYYGSGWRVVCVDGGWANGSDAGLFFLDSDVGSSDYYPNIGSRLLVLPDES